MKKNFLKTREEKLIYQNSLMTLQEKHQENIGQLKTQRNNLVTMNSILKIELDLEKNKGRESVQDLSKNGDRLSRKSSCIPTIYEQISKTMTKLSIKQSESRVSSNFAIEPLNKIRKKSLKVLSEFQITDKKKFNKRFTRIPEVHCEEKKKLVLRKSMGVSLKYSERNVKLLKIEATTNFKYIRPIAKEEKGVQLDQDPLIR